MGTDRIRSRDTSIAAGTRFADANALDQVPARSFVIVAFGGRQIDDVGDCLVA